MQVSELYVDILKEEDKNTTIEFRLLCVFLSTLNWFFHNMFHNTKCKTSCFSILFLVLMQACVWKEERLKKTESVHAKGLLHLQKFYCTAMLCYWVFESLRILSVAYSIPVYEKAVGWKILVKHNEFESFFINTLWGFFLVLTQTLD